MAGAPLDIDDHLWELVAGQGYGENIKGKVHPKVTACRKKSLPKSPRHSPKKKSVIEEHRTPFIKKKGGFDFLRDGCDNDLLWDMLVLEGFLNNPTWEVYTALSVEETAVRMEYAHCQGDAITLVNLVRAWYKQPNVQAKRKLCVRYGVTEDIRQVMNYVKSRFHDCSMSTTGCGPRGEVPVDTLINQLLVHCGDNLAVYRGHPSLGYKHMKTGHTFRLHELSTLNLLTRPPRFIIIMGHSMDTRDVVRYATEVSVDEARKLYDLHHPEKDFQESVAKSVTECITFQPDFDTLDYINEHFSLFEQHLRDVCGDDYSVVMDTLGSHLHVYCLKEHSQKATECITEVIHNCENAKADYGIEVFFPTRRSAIRAVVTDGWSVDKILLPWQHRSLHIIEMKPDHLNEEYVREKLEGFGQIATVNQYPTDTKDDLKRWGYVTFVAPETLQKFTQSNFQDDLMCFETQTANEIIRNEDNHIRLFTKNDIQTLVVTGLPLEKKDDNGLDSFTKKLIQVLDMTVDMRKVYICDFMKSSSSHLQVELRIKDSRVTASCQEVLSETKFGGKSISLHPVNGNGEYRVSWKLLTNLGSVVRRFTQTIDFRSQITNMNILWSTISDTRVQLCMLSRNYETLLLACNAIDELLRNPCIYKLPQITDCPGPRALDQTMHQTNTFISYSSSRHCLRIFGTRSNIRKAYKHLDEYVENNKVPFFDLQDKQFATDILLNLVKDFGSDLRGLTKLYDQTELVLDTAKRRLYYSTGGGNDIQESLLKRLKERYTVPYMSSQNCNKDVLYECQACFTTLSTDEKCISLPKCKHAYCVECINTHIAVSLETKTFPVCCIACDSPIPLGTLSGLSRRFFVTNKHKLTLASVTAYMASNPQTFRFCHALDCEGLTFSQPDSDAWKCAVCSTLQCPLCKNDHHPKITCEEFFGNVGLQNWLNDGGDRKKCPKCSQPIEKDGGCHRVQCLSCHAEICWKCLKYFDKSFQCYDHLRKEHGGIGL